MRYSGECMDCGTRSKWEGRRPTEVAACPKCGSGPGCWMISKLVKDRWELVDTFSGAFAAATGMRRGGR